MAIATLGSMEEGNIIRLNEDGAPVEFYVAKQDYESELNGPGRVLVVRKDCYDERQWHHIGDQYNLYEDCDLDVWFNDTYKSLLDLAIRTAMGTTKFKVNDNQDQLERAVFALSAVEIGCKSDSYTPADGTALNITVIDLIKRTNLEYWTRSRRKMASYSVFTIDVNGVETSRGPDQTFGSRPVFTLPSCLYVLDDGFVSGYDIPDAPSSITVPDEVLGGTSLTVTWGTASDLNDNLTGYELERQVDGGEWTQVYKGEATSYTDAITRGWLTVAYRVRAYDSYGATSDYTTGTAREVNNNRAPAIVCTPASGSDLGVKGEGFTIAYSATDADGDPVTVTEAIDGVTLRTFTPEAEEDCTFALTGETWMKILNGAHELSITASDGQAQAVHTLAFTKSVTAASITLAQPMEADGPITLCVLSVTGSIPEDADYSVQVTNNAKDDAPVWEDCTDEVKLGANHVFANDTATNGFAFNFLVSVERGESGQGGYINSVQGGFQ